MATIIADCPNHGPIAVDDMFGGVGSVTVTATAVRCPQCGAMSTVPEGQYTFDDDTRPGWTYFRPLTASQRKRLGKSLAWVREELAKDDPDEERAARVLEKTIEHTAPQMKGFLDRIRDPAVGNIGAWVAILISVLMWLVQPQPEGITPDELERILAEVVKNAQLEQATPAPATPMPQEAVTQDPAPAPAATAIPTPKTR